MTKIYTRHLRYVAILLISIHITGCGFFPKRTDPGNALATTACPKELPPLTEDSFGATTKKLVEVAGIYHQCATAARGAK